MPTTQLDDLYQKISELTINNDQYEVQLGALLLENRSLKGVNRLSYHDNVTLTEIFQNILLFILDHQGCPPDIRTNIKTEIIKLRGTRMQSLADIILGKIDTVETAPGYLSGAQMSAPQITHNRRGKKFNRRSRNRRTNRRKKNK